MSISDGGGIYRAAMRLESNLIRADHCWFILAEDRINALKRLRKPMTTTTDTNHVSTTVCPNCKSTSCDRIPRPTVYKLLFPWMKAKHYLCLKCFKKFSKKA